QHVDDVERAVGFADVAHHVAGGNEAGGGTVEEVVEHEVVAVCPQARLDARHEDRLRIAEPAIHEELTLEIGPYLEGIDAQLYALPLGRRHQGGEGRERGKRGVVQEGRVDHLPVFRSP